MACGHILYAVRRGMADCTPNLRAAYDAADTTPRSLGRPPTTTGLPLREGSNSSSTETKKASMSRWKNDLMVFGPLRREAGRPGQRRLQHPANRRALREPGPL